jgi:parallel beta-helix repeat protein
MTIYTIFLLITAGFTGVLFIDWMIDSGAAEGSRTTIIVASNGHGDYTRIQDGIDNATAGDTIRVWAGIYYETVIVNKTVSLIGNGSSYSTIDGNQMETVVLITTDLVNLSGFKIMDGSTGLLKAGIHLNNVLDCNISDNDVYNNQEGIYLNNVHYGKFYNNKVRQSNNQGFLITSSSTSNMFINNTILNCGVNGFQLSGASNNLLQNNKCNFNYNGMYLNSCTQNEFLNNDWSDNSLTGIEFYLSGNNEFIECSVLNNNYGCNIHSASSGNTFENCSVSANNIYDFHLAGTSKKNVLINTPTFKISIADTKPELIVKNYLHLKATDYTGKPQKGVEVKIVDNNRLIYITEEFNGFDRKTDDNGELKWILLTDRIYDGSALPDENITKVTLEFENKSIESNNRNVNMSYTHFEYFYLNSIPTGVEPETPGDNSYVNRSYPELKWQAAADADEDALSYHVQITSASADWNSLLAQTLTATGKLKWRVPVDLEDGKRYQWRVCATDGRINGTWSNTFQFWVDLDYPMAYKPRCGFKINNTGIVNWSWMPANDTGSGILGYYVSLFDKAKSAFVKDAWTTNTWYKESHLLDGESYFCRIKVKNGAESISPYSKESEVVKIDQSPPKSPESITITPNSWTSTNLFNIDWDPPVDYTGIRTGTYYYIGPSPPDEQSDGIWASEKPIILDDVPEGLNNIYLWLVDNAGNTDIVNYAEGLIRFDSKPPKIEHVKVTTGVVGEALEISATIIDDSTGIRSATIFCKRESDATFTKFTMVGKDNVYTSWIPDGYMVGEGVSYYLQAIDNSEPENTIYYGVDGETIIEPTIMSDIDLNLPITILDHSPKGDSVSLRNNIWVKFDRTMNRETAKDAFSIAPEVNGIYAWDENKLTLMPGGSLSPGTKYTVTISEIAKDSRGNNLKLPYKWSFTTEKLVEKDPENKTNDPKKNDDDGQIFGAPQILVISIVGVIIVVIIIVVVALVIRRKRSGFSKKTKPKYSGPQQILGTSSTTSTTPTTTTTQAQTTPQPYTQVQEQVQAQAQAQLQPQVQVQPQPQPQPQPQSTLPVQQPSGQKKTLVVQSCPSCQAKILTPDKCPYCGWNA